MFLFLFKHFSCGPGALLVHQPRYTASIFSFSLSGAVLLALRSAADAGVESVRPDRSLLAADNKL
jgi:hypothetical protein